MSSDFHWSNDSFLMFGLLRRKTIGGNFDVGDDRVSGRFGCKTNFGETTTHLFSFAYVSDVLNQPVPLDV